MMNNRRNEPALTVDAQKPDEHANEHRLPTSIFKLQLNSKGIPATLKFRQQKYRLPELASTINADGTRPLHDGQQKPKEYRSIKFLGKNQSQLHGTSLVRQESPNKRISTTNKRRRLNDPRNKTRFTIARPLNESLEVDADVWRLILGFTTPKSLLRMRFVSVMFHNLLKESAIWKTSRERHYGLDMPNRPYFLSEQEYVNLIEGSGCQRRGCLRRDTRKAYWTFGVRFCEECLFAKTSRGLPADSVSPQRFVSDLLPEVDITAQYGRSPLDLIPTAILYNGKYETARSVDDIEHKWGLLRGNPTLLYLKADYERLMSEFETARVEAWSPERILNWIKDRYQEAVHHCEAVSGFENHPEFFLRESDELARMSLAQEKDNLFAREAIMFDHQLSLDVLKCMSAYNAAVRTPNRASLRAWESLLPKILPYREEAIRVRDFQSTQLDLEIGTAIYRWPDSARIYKELHDRRGVSVQDSEAYSEEQKFVMRLAREVFDSIKDDTADEDLVLFCLRKVHDMYESLSEKPAGFTFNGIYEEYSLSLDDARLIVEEVIQPQFKAETIQAFKIFESFKCTGCTRGVLGRRWTFRSVFEHIFEKHATIVGKNLYFSRFAINFVPPLGPHDCNLIIKSSKKRASYFPWYLVEWTKTLPLLPSYAEVNSSTKWLPDSTEPYQKIVRVGTCSAFDGRTAKAFNTMSDDSFEISFSHAAKMLAATTLDGICISGIALRYSLGLRSQEKTDQLTLDTFLRTLQSVQNRGILLVFKSKCGACCAQPDSSMHIKCAKMTVSIDLLRKHWDKVHKQQDVDWKKCFFPWPSDEALLELMMNHDSELRHKQAQSTERETTGILKTVRKLPDPKAAALMEKKLALDVFDILFPKESDTIDS